VEKQDREAKARERETRRAEEKRLRADQNVERQVERWLSTLITHLSKRVEQARLFQAARASSQTAATQASAARPTAATQAPLQRPRPSPGAQVLSAVVVASRCLSSAPQPGDHVCGPLSVLPPPPCCVLPPGCMQMADSMAAPASEPVRAPLQWKPTWLPPDGQAYVPPHGPEYGTAWGTRIATHVQEQGRANAQHAQANAPGPANVSASHAGAMLAQQAPGLALAHWVGPAAGHSSSAVPMRLPLPGLLSSAPSQGLPGQPTPGKQLPAQPTPGQPLPWQPLPWQPPPGQPPRLEKQLRFSCTNCKTLLQAPLPEVIRSGRVVAISLVCPSCRTTLYVTWPADAQIRDASPSAPSTAACPTAACPAAPVAVIPSMGPNCPNDLMAVIPSMGRVEPEALSAGGVTSVAPAQQAAQPHGGGGAPAAVPSSQPGGIGIGGGAPGGGARARAHLPEPDSKFPGDSDCGACKNCLDKPKFGGPNTRRKACELKDSHAGLLSMQTSAAEQSSADGAAMPWATPSGVHAHDPSTQPCA